MPRRSSAKRPQKAAKTAARQHKTRARTRKPALRARATARSADPGAAFCKAVDDTLNAGNFAAISDETLQRVFAAAVRLYAAKTEDSGDTLLPFDINSVTATEAVVASCGIIRAADLNLFDMAMWFRRPLPDV